MSKYSQRSFIALLILFFIPAFVSGMDPSKKKKPVKSAVSKTDPTLSMTKQRQRKLVKVKRNFARKKRLSMIQGGSITLTI